MKALCESRKIHFNEICFPGYLSRYGCLAVWRRNPHAGDMVPAKQKEELKNELKDELKNEDGYGPTGPTGKPASASTLPQARRTSSRTASPHLAARRMLQRAPRTLQSRLPVRRTAAAPRLPQAAAPPAAARAMVC